jgi:hypothetical protein
VNYYGILYVIVKGEELKYCKTLKIRVINCLKERADGLQIAVI